VLCLAAGCRGEAVPAGPGIPAPDAVPAGPEVVVAHAGDRRVTLAELQAFLAAFPDHRQDELARPEGRRAFLRNYLLFQEALRRAGEAGYAGDPRVRAARDRAMVRLWTEERLDTFQAPPVTPDELRSRFRHEVPPPRPRRVRANHILLRDRGEAEALRRRLLEACAEPAADCPEIFAAAARDRSLDARTRDRGGDLLFFSKDRSEAAWRTTPAMVLEAALGMPSTGQVSAVVASPEGAHLVMVTAVRGETRPSFEEAAPALRDALLGERRAAAEDALEDELLDMDAWTVDDGALAGLSVPGTGE